MKLPSEIIYKGMPITGDKGYTQPRHLEADGWLALQARASVPKESPGAHFTGAEWAPGPAWTRMKKKLHTLRRQGPNPCRPPRINQFLNRCNCESNSKVF